MIYYYCTYYKCRINYHKVIKVCLKNKYKKLKMHNKLKKEQNTFTSKLGGQTKNWKVKL